MRRFTLFLLAAVTAGLTASSVDAQIFRRRVVYTDPYYYGYTWTYPSYYYSTAPAVSNGVSITATTPAVTATTSTPVTTTTTTNGQVVYPATYTTPSTSYYYPSTSYYYPTSSYYYPSSSYYYPSSYYWSGYYYPTYNYGWRGWFGRWR